MQAPISIVLDRKGRDVATIRPDETLEVAAQRLTEQGIGALVVTEDDVHVAGILSERDIVHRLAREGVSALGRSVVTAMTTQVTTCTPGTAVDELYRVLTEQRIRHVPVVEAGRLPVVEAGRLVGIVSIGDLVKWRMEELADEAHHLQDYVRGSY
jgi:CBS domain-containing protein